ncbi:MAG: cache domain-containing protein [Candidatus Aminicenantes bacterium]|nr:cache domain-containing protein [Candidatus Aminicenantes bacterium]
MSLRFIDLPLRRKMTFVILAILCLGGLFSIILGMRLEHRTIVSLAETRVRHDMASARAIYASFLENMMTAVTIAAEADTFRLFNSARPDNGLNSILAQTAQIGRLDFLSFSDTTGRVIARSDPAAKTGNIRDRDSFFARILGGERISATRILSLESLRKESPRLAESGVGDALVLVAAVPVRDREGGIIGILSGGRRINGDNEIVDRIKATIFESERYGDLDAGVVTIFQGDVRAATTLDDGRGGRLTGTRADPAFRRAALEKGRPWTGRARVLNEWYIGASEPLLDHDGAVAGMLSLGLLERPFLALRNEVIAKFTGLGVFIAAVLLMLLTYLMTRLTRPLGDMVAAASRVALGDLNLQVSVKSRDEIGELGEAFNRMTTELRKAKEHLLQWTWTLESRVAERTRELQNIQESMARSEKMASLGQLSAGIAHEINNPLTAILLNAHLLLEKAGPDDPAAAALRLIAEETERCGWIVKGLLEYSRQTQPEKISVDINILIERTVGLLSGQAWARNVRIVQDLDRSLPPLFLDGAKIQQVFWNLILNSCEAMPGGGEIGVSSRRSPDGRHVEVVFADSGPGIPKENIGRIFDPFFTTKPSGTGLGLAVACGIVEQHGGTIAVRNETGRGAVFTIQWPVPEAEIGNKGISA